MAKKSKEKKIRFRWLKIIVAIFFVLAVLVFAYAYIYYIRFDQKFFPGTKMGMENLSGKNYLEALNYINEYTKKVEKDGFIYRYQQNEVSVLPTVSSTESPDFVYEIVKFNEQLTIDKAFDYGRQGNIWSDFIRHFSALVSGLEANVAYELNDQELEKILRENFSQYEEPAQDAHLKLNDREEFEITPEKEGTVFNYGGIISETRKRINNLDTGPVTIGLEKDYPRIKRDETSKALGQIDGFLALAPLTLSYGDQKWEISTEQLKQWLDFKYKEGKIGLGFNERLKEYLSSEIAAKINREVQEGKFEIKEGKVSEFQASENGLAVDLEKSIERIEQTAVDGAQRGVALVVNEVQPTITTASINNLGIKEVVGRGTSNFRGSPRNRIHNIRQGASTLHGLLVKPGEEFSLVKALGKIEASTGYLPELVIKGNKTVPEYGGGLCQIGTTAFRLAIHTGLPITERKPHSYRVSYYEPAGFDATIYDPKPDLKFINDTGNYLLLQTRIEGYDLIFEFYGTYDGRKIEVTNPTLSNYVSPPPTKYIESDDLAPGEKKCTERAHTGASAVFYRTITYPSGEQKKETWSSVYRPWQEVCLIGTQA